MSTSFNFEQMVTIEQARGFAQTVNSRGIATGVAPEDDSENYVNDASGIYLDVWEPGPAGFPRPSIGEARQYLLRFNPTPGGFSPGGFNIGLSISMALRHGSLTYALDSLAAEVADQIKNAEGN